MSIPACSTARPGGGSVNDYRTLHVPQAFVDAAAPSEVAWMSKRLCCVYTRVQVTDRAEPYLVNYDADERPVAGADTFEDAASAAYDDVCDMGMGSEDCSSQRECVEDAREEGATARSSSSGARQRRSYSAAVGLVWMLVALVPSSALMSR